MRFRDLEWRRHMASLVLRPVDMLRYSTGRPPYEHGPVYPVQLGLNGEVMNGTLQVFRRDPPVPVRNLSGDLVFRDLDLAAGMYRIAIDRNTGQRGDSFYEDVDPADRDIGWQPAGEFRLEVEGRPHPSQLHKVPLYPAATYPFPPESTLVRGSLLWYDGTALDGAVVRDGDFDNTEKRATLISRSRVGPRGDFVLAHTERADSNTVELVLDLSEVNHAAKPDGAVYKERFPPSIPGIRWRRGGTVSVPHSALRGVVYAPGGPPARGATVSIASWPGTVTTDERGRWQYHFPPGAPLLPDRVQLVFRHPDYADRVLDDVPVVADATTQVPAVRFTSS